MRTGGILSAQSRHDKPCDHCWIGETACELDNNFNLLSRRRSGLWCRLHSDMTRWLINSLHRFLIACLFALPIATVGAVPPPPANTRGGLTISLSTSSHLLPQATGEPLRGSFTAAVSLTNQSRRNLSITFPDALAAKNRFVFRILDASGTERWQSEPSPVSTAGSQVFAPLGGGKVWRRTIEVPLAASGKALAPGIYTLEVAVADGGSLGASTRFEIFSPWGELAADTGVDGVVFLAPDNSRAANADFYIRELREPSTLDGRPRFASRVRTDGQGNFRFLTPPGRYAVVTDAGLGTGLLIPNQEFLVTAGSFTHLSFSLPKPRVLPLDYDSWNSSLSLKLWSDYTTDDLIIEATATTPSSGHSALLVSRGTGVDGVARFDFGIRRPTGPVTFAFEPVRASVKFARAPGLLRIEVNGIAVSLLEIIPAPALTADTGIDGLTANYDGIAKVNVPFPGLWVEVEEDRSRYGNPDRPPSKPGPVIPIDDIVAGMLLSSATACSHIMRSKSAFSSTLANGTPPPYEYPLGPIVAVELSRTDFKLPSRKRGKRRSRCRHC